MSRMATPHKDPKSGVYYFRMAVPKDLVPIIGKTAFKTSLKTKSLNEAKQIFPSYLEEAHREIELAKLKLSDEPSVKLTVRDCVILAERWYIRVRDRMEASGDFTEILVRDAQWCGGEYQFHEFGLSDTLPISGSEIVRATESQLRELAEDLREHIESQLDIEGIAVPFSSANFIQLGRAFYPYVIRLESLCRARYKDDWTYQPLNCELADKELSVRSEVKAAPLMLNTQSITSFKTQAISAVLEDFIVVEKAKVNAKSARSKTLDETKSRISKLISFLGDHDVAKFKRSDIVQLRDILCLIPKTSDKALLAKPVAEQIRICEEKKMDRYAANTVIKDLKLLSRVFSHAIDRGYIETNPVNGVTVKSAADKSQVKAAKGYTEGDIQLIFKDEVFHVEDAPKIYDMACYWIPLICRYTGARINEIAQLRKVDVCKSESGIDYLYIRQGDEQNVKTVSSVREIPIPEHIKELGFLDYVASTTDWLFPKLPTNMYGDKGLKIGQWWGKRVRSKNIVIAQPSHAFRHTFKTQMRSLFIEDSVSDAITGHAATTEGGRYGTVALEVKKVAIDKLPRLDLQRIW